MELGRKNSSSSFSSSSSPPPPSTSSSAAAALASALCASDKKVGERGKERVKFKPRATLVAFNDAR